VNAPVPGTPRALTLFIDADDTLWENNVYFDAVIARTTRRLTAYGVASDVARDTLLDIERHRTRVHGYGSGNFGLSLEVLCEQVGVPHALGDLRPFLRAEVAALRRKRLEILPGVPDTLAWLRRRHRLVLFTKGNHDEQWDKVVRSGLRPLFHQVDVVREKHVEAYRDAARRLGAEPARSWMIGNSPKSDILPAHEAGFGTVLVPHAGTWALEMADLPDTVGPRMRRVGQFSDLVDLF
jgi:putative hydrolase of the HAD superfamily